MIQTTSMQPDTRPRAPAEPRSFPDPGGRLARGWALRLTAAWLGVLTVGMALEPAPAEGEGTGLVSAILSAALMASWAVMAVGFTKRIRLGAFASLAGAVTLVAFTIGCPVSGHHTGIGAWWFVQLAGSMALVGLSGRAVSTSHRVS